jgi:protein involved in polysaccharide export with SLBB domain
VGPHYVRISVRISDTAIVNEEETTMQVSTLRDRRCRLFGAVMNRCLNDIAGDHLRLRLMTLVLLLSPFHNAIAAENQAPTSPPPPVLSAPVAPTLSATTVTQLAPWQQRLTLGPGDVLDISIYDIPESKRSAVAIGPDGTLNYLQVRDFAATGFTVDELRQQLDKQLAKFYLAPRVVIVPLAYRSKKFVLLGAVQQKGVLTLDRPLTVIEAIVMGGGFESTMEGQNVSMVVDLGRSFLVRKQPAGEFTRYPVDFEALFMQGDLRHNVALEPDDYLYFPPLGIQEIYMVGEVRGPGSNPFTKDLTVMAAIAARGGYTEKAWRSKILVIRGSLNHPQTFTINTSDVLKGKANDFVLNNRDIVYVSRKPWAYAEELLEEAVNQFLYAAVIGYTGQHVGPWIKEPIIK